MCHSVDEHKCASACVKVQQGRKIIEEPQMKECTNSCLRQGRQADFPGTGLQIESIFTLREQSPFTLILRTRVNREQLGNKGEPQEQSDER